LNIGLIKILTITTWVCFGFVALVSIPLDFKGLDYACVILTFICALSTSFGYFQMKKKKINEDKN